MLEPGPSHTARLPEEDAPPAVGAPAKEPPGGSAAGRRPRAFRPHIRPRRIVGARPAPEASPAAQAEVTDGAPPAAIEAAVEAAPAIRGADRAPAPGRDAWAGVAPLAHGPDAPAISGMSPAGPLVPILRLHRRARYPLRARRALELAHTLLAELDRLQEQIHERISVETAIQPGRSAPTPAGRMLAPDGPVMPLPRPAPLWELPLVAELERYVRALRSFVDGIEALSARFGQLARLLSDREPGRDGDGVPVHRLGTRAASTSIRRWQRRRAGRRAPAGADGADRYPGRRGRAD